MDRSLDEIINEKPRGAPRGRGPRGGGRRPGPTRDYDNAPRDGVKKQYGPREQSRNIDRDWVHDKYDDDADMRRGGRRDDGYAAYNRDDIDDRQGPKNSRLRVENLHYDLGEKDLKELFARMGPVTSVNMLYDRHDRSKGIAFVTYDYEEDARRAVREFNGANAYGQPIRVELQPSAGRAPRNPFDNVERPSRSLFDRIDARDAVPTARGGGRRRNRSTSPGAANVDRYVPGRDSRSPVRRRGTPREGGRRPGARREDSGRRGGRRGDGEGRPTGGARPRKTAEELDAEMNDYWGGGGAGANPNAQAANGEARESQAVTAQNTENPMTGATSAINADDDIDLMVE